MRYLFIYTQDKEVRNELIKKGCIELESRPIVKNGEKEYFWIFENKPDVQFELKGNYTLGNELFF